MESPFRDLSDHLQEMLSSFDGGDPENIVVAAERLSRWSKKERDGEAVARWEEELFPQYTFFLDREDVNVPDFSVALGEAVDELVLMEGDLQDEDVEEVVYRIDCLTCLIAARSRQQALKGEDD